MSKRKDKLNVSEADIRAVYREGEEAVVLFVQSLIERIDRTEERLDEIENQQKKDSRNSSKPPSGDGFGKRTKSLRQRSERPSGGQKGHPGSTLEWREAVDEVVTHRVSSCECCGGSLESTPVVDHKCRQVHELPLLQLQVIEHRAEVKRCGACESISRDSFPADVGSRVQYGSGMRALMVYLMDA